MINIENQNELFKLIAEYLSDDVECIGFGGTAMMYYQFKDSTKDIDLLFSSEKDRDIFIKAIEKLGYHKKQNLLSIYGSNKLKPNTPLMYVRNDERFDLFSEKVFHISLTESMLKRSRQIRDFNGKKRLRIKILSPEDLFLLKSVTSRERDFADILTILDNVKDFNWDSLIEETLLQSKIGDGWARLDVEQTLLKLKVPDEYLKKLYG
jgi:hypothetical protein